MDPEFIGIIWKVIKYVCGCWKEEADYILHLETNVDSLRGNWKQLQKDKAYVEAQVEEAEYLGGKQRPREVEGWFQQIQAIQKEVDDTIKQGAEEIQNKCIFDCSPKNCVSSYKLGKNVSKWINEVNKLLAEGERYCKNDKITIKLPIMSVEMLVDETVGMDLMVEKVWKSIEEENVSIIGLYGMGGAGKTTLLKRINNALIGSRKPKFDPVMWFVISKEPIDKIMDNIRTWLGIEDEVWGQYKDDQDRKAAKISNVLKRKNFVLLLDDIWDKVDLVKVGIPTQKVTGFQSKVIFTTRSPKICEDMNPQRKFKVECLTENEAFELLCKKVGEETLNSHPEIPNLARDIAAKCEGLPLALIVVGSAMAAVKDLEVWEHSRNNLPSSSLVASDLEKSVFSILKFSYDQLPNEQHKSCFLYCALYQKDNEIHVNHLIDKWICEGFLGSFKSKTIEKMRSDGKGVIEKLKHLCLLESVEDDLVLGRTIKMHDMIRDMALWLARDQDKNKNKTLVLTESSRLASQADVETCEVVGRVSGVEYFVPAANCPNLTTLMFQSKNLFDGKKSLSNVNRMSRLKVLDLWCGSTILQLPAEIGDLVDLEYLSLEGGLNALEFPMELKNLRKLKHFALYVRKGDLAGIPLEVIANLEELRVLRFSNIFGRESKEERELLEKLESLQHLEELEILLKSKNGVMKLLESTELQACVRSLGLTTDLYGHIDMSLSLLLESMSEMKKLQKIYFAMLSFIEDCCVSEMFCSLSMLRKVYISECDTINHLTWLKYAPLQQLEICYCESLEELIKDETDENEKGRENVDQKMFSSLVELKLRQLPKLKSIHNTPLRSASILRSILIRGCPNLQKLPIDSNTVIPKLRKIEGQQEWWNSLKWEDPTIKQKCQSIFVNIF